MGEGAVVEMDLTDDEYAIPGALNAYVAEHRRVEAWPEKAQRRIDGLEKRVQHLEELVHRLVNASPDRRWAGAVQTIELNNPYSLAAFTPVSDDDWKRLDGVVSSALGHGIDRYSAAAMRHAWDACVASIREFATEGDAQDAMG